MPAAHKASKKSDNSKYAPTSWGKEYTCDLEVPSGQLCLVRRPGITGLIKAGLLDSLDALTGLVQTEHIDRVEPSPEGERRKVELADMQDLMRHPERLEAAMKLVEKVVSYVVVEPSLALPPEEGVEREQGVVYVDSVAIEDQFFIFNFVLGGTEDLTAFRSQFGANVAGLEGLSGLSSPTI